ncbi:MAG: Polysaccharide export protein [Pedosphaera sp.]|nr:Polysaccharide export protein [Pedosphaera sp.]
MKNHSCRWLVLIHLTLFSGWHSAIAADAPPAAGGIETTNLSLAAPAKRAEWQRRLTLGPGDALNFSMFINDAAEQPRENVVIGPDGRISYLQAQDIMAAGLTIDELRTKMDVELGKFYRSPKTIIFPAAMHSKKYFVLGAIVNKGVFTFDRPLTVIEAIARAGGLETGVFERNTVETADLSHSFLVRQGKRIPVDFQKLFQHGDLSQNIALEPNDYLYFASASANEVYVLGEVLAPGTMPLTGNATTIAAITTRGGFTSKAYKTRVLIIRGSLTHPETFVVNTSEILDAKAKDFKLQPKDIIYVAPRPWHKVEELLDDATRAFIEGVVITYTGARVGPFIDPIIK